MIQSHGNTYKNDNCCKIKVPEPFMESWKKILKEERKKISKT